MCLCLLTKTQFKIIKNLPTTKSQLKKKRQPHLEKPRKSQKKVGDLPQNRPCKKDPPKEKLAKANHKVFFEIDFPLLELVTPLQSLATKRQKQFIHSQLAKSTHSRSQPIQHVWAIAHDIEIEHFNLAHASQQEVEKTPNLTWKKVAYGKNKNKGGSLQPSHLTRPKSRSRGL